MKTYSSKFFAQKIKRLSLEMIFNSQSSHIGSCLSIADLIAVLYNDILFFDPKNASLKERDRFILSKGHACAALYAALAVKGFFNINELSKFAQLNSKLMSHASHKVCGVEFSTGSLGHGLPFAVGKALSSKLKRQDWFVYVVLSDGELNEGSNWESLMFAAHHKIDNLCIIIDNNKLQSLTTTKKTLNLKSLKQKFKVFGLNTYEVDGHNHSELKKVLCKKVKKKNKPKIVIANTIKGNGIDFMENKVEWHYRSPDKDQYNTALKQIKSNL